MNNKQTGNYVRLLLENFPPDTWLDIVGKIKLEKDGSILVPQLMASVGYDTDLFVQDLYATANDKIMRHDSIILNRAANKITQLQCEIDILKRGMYSRIEASEPPPEQSE
jgi:hypothetical protein